MALALVVIEEHARRAMHLRDDDALGAVDDEGAVRRHEGHVAHVDVLLLDVLDRLRLRVGIDIEHDEAQRHLQRRGEGHAALAALVDVIFRLLELVAHEFEQRDLREIGNREDGFEDGLQTLVGAAALGLVDEQELIVGGLLHFDQIGHFRGFADMSEEFADTLATGELAAPTSEPCRFSSLFVVRAGPLVASSVLARQAPRHCGVFAVRRALLGSTASRPRRAGAAMSRDAAERRRA